MTAFAKTARLTFACAAAGLLSAPALADQSSIVQPTTGPHTQADLQTNYLNPALRALLSNSSRSNAPTNGPGAMPVLGQYWLDTSTTPNTVREYDGAAWVALGTLNAAAHAWTPQLPSQAGYGIGLTYTGISTAAIPPFITAIYTTGWSSAGDLGSRMPMVVGTSSGFLATQSLDGRYWVLDATALPDIPVGFCGATADDATDNTAQVQTCATIANVVNKPLRIRTNGAVLRIGGAGSVNSNAGIIGDDRNTSNVRNMNLTTPLFYVSSNQSSLLFTGVHYLPYRAPAGSLFSTTTTAASTTSTMAVTSASGLTVGMAASGAGIAGDVRVTSISGSSVTISSAVNVASGAAVTFAPLPTGGATFYIDAPSGSYAYNPNIHGNFFQGQYTDVYCNRCNIPTVHDNTATDYIFADAVLDNVDFIDNGDQKYYGNSSFTGYAGATQVLQLAAGGLIMTQNKGGGGAHCYQMKLRDGASTSILFINHNSCEGVAGSPISIAKQGDQTFSTGYFETVSIFDNELANTTDDPLMDIEGGTWLFNVKTGRNHLVLHNTNAAAIGIKVNGAANFESAFDDFAGFGGGTALYIAPGTIAHLGPITASGVPTACQCLSTSITYDGFSLTKVVPFPGSPSLAADSALPSGPVNLPSFEYDPLTSSNNSTMFSDLAVNGLVAGYSFSAALSSVYDRSAQPLQVLTAFQDPLPSGSGPQPLGFFYSAPDPSTSAIKISTTLNAGAAGSTFTAKWNIKSGAGTFKTLP